MNHNTLPQIGDRYRVTSAFSREDAKGKKPTVVGRVISINKAHRFAVLKIEFPTGFYTESFAFDELAGREVR